MNTELTPTKRRWELIVFFALTYLITWAIEIPFALAYQGFISSQIPPGFHYLASCGPLLAAITVTIFAEGFSGLKRLFNGMAKWRVGRDYALFAIGAPVILFCLAVVVSRLMQGFWLEPGLLGEVDYLGRIGIPLALGLWMLTFGFAEETGWRGFALPRLQANRSALSASLLLGVFWATWHLPAFFYRDTYLAMGLAIGFPILLISVAAASTVFTWLFNGTGGSLLMVVLFHGLFDFFSVSEAGGEGAAIVMSAAIVFWAVRVYKLYGSASLSPGEKVVV